MNTIPEQMTAWSIGEYGKAEDLHLVNVPVPQPEPGQVLVQIEATGLNPVDLKLMVGTLRDFMPTHFPLVPGVDAVGRVVAIGEGVQQYNIADRVLGINFGQGGLATYMILPEGATLTLAPNDLIATDLAALPMAGLTALAIMRALGALEGKTIAVIGATGGVGLFVTQLASRDGAHVIASARGGGAEVVRSNGAQTVIDYTKRDTISQLLEQYPDGVDAVVDLVNMFDGLLTSANGVKPGGKLVSSLLGPDPSVVPNGVQAVYVRMNPEPGDLERLVSDLARDQLRANVSRVHPFAEARAAYLDLRDGHPSGKVIVSHD